MTLSMDPHLSFSPENVGYKLYIHYQFKQQQNKQQTHTHTKTLLIKMVCDEESLSVNEL